MPNSILNLNDSTNKLHQFVLNLRKLMEEKKVNAVELARAIGLPHTTIHKILAGKTEDPRLTTLQLIANFFGVTIDQLLNGNEKRTALGQAVPIIALSDCIKENFTKTLNIDNWNNWIIVDQISNYNTFGITTTASMESRFPKGTVLIVEPDIPAEDGDLVIVHYANSEEATVRELSIDGPNKFLLPLNVNLNKDAFSEKIQILGVVVQSRFTYSK